MKEKSSVVKKYCEENGIEYKDIKVECKKFNNYGFILDDSQSMSQKQLDDFVELLNSIKPSKLEKAMK